MDHNPVFILQQNIIADITRQSIGHVEINRLVFSLLIDANNFSLFQIGFLGQIAGGQNSVFDGKIIRQIKTSALAHLAANGKVRLFLKKPFTEYIYLILGHQSDILRGIMIEN